MNYKKASYGPYAENLRHVLRSIEGHYISGYADGGDAPNKTLNLVPGAVKDAMDYLQVHPETFVRFDRVSKLVEGFESSFGLELLATVHWVASRNLHKTKEEIVALTYAWNSRKRRLLSERQILLALRTLNEQEWI